MRAKLLLGVQQTAKNAKEQHYQNEQQINYGYLPPKKLPKSYL